MYGIVSGEEVKTKNDAIVFEQYKKDVSRYSWRVGDDTVLQKARSLCQSIPHLEDVLLSLMQFNGESRMRYEVDFDVIREM